MQRKWICGILILALGIGVAWYFWPRRVGEGGPLELLLYTDVQNELNLSDDQISKTTRLVQTNWKAFEDLGLDKQNALKGKTIVRETMKSLMELLTPEQFHRLEQLQLQQLGPSIFLDRGPGVVRKLGLTEQQKDKIKELLLTSSKKRYELYGKGAFKKLGMLDKDIFSTIMNDLNGDQKRIIQNILGEPFKGKLPPVAPMLPREAQIP